jgi:hypothetical protein
MRPESQALARGRRLSKAIRVNAGAKELLAASALAGRLSPMHISRFAAGAVIAVLLSGNAIAGGLGGLPSGLREAGLCGGHSAMSAAC